MSGMDVNEPSMSAMPGAFGPYAFTREASGTAWQPDTSVHDGVHGAAGPWMLMGHALLNGVYDWQQGPRGADKAFLSGMAMGLAQRNFSSGDAIRFRAMMSPDPFMGRRGYPLLLASGETADGVAPLVDRQHPHDLLMELSASYSHAFNERDSVFVYAGLPGEPAFGPPAFMHRLTAIDSPEAPISHHWLDSTHITFGVVTLGYVHDGWKVEASRFRGREPDERRYDIETGPLDSSAVRVSWNPAPKWSLQGSWARVESPEQLHPDDNQTKWSASALYTSPLESGYWSVTFAWGRRTAEHESLDAYLIEAALKPNGDWTFFTRAERVKTNELGGSHGAPVTVGKASIGAVRDFRVTSHTVLGVGALYEATALPRSVATSYGGAHPSGAMIFVRLKLA